MSTRNRTRFRLLETGECHSIPATLYRPTFRTVCRAHAQPRVHFRVNAARLEKYRLFFREFRVATHGEIKPRQRPLLLRLDLRSSPPHTSRRYGKIAWHVWTGGRARGTRAKRGKNPCADESVCVCALRARLGWRYIHCFARVYVQKEEPTAQGKWQFVEETSELFVLVRDGDTFFDKRFREFSS